MILITGASSGIGEACARVLAASKHGLILTGRRIDRLQTLAAELKREHGIEAHAIQLDVTRLQDVQKFAQEHAPLLERTTVLINNAGLAKGVDLLQDGDPEDWDAMIDTNIKGLLYVTRAVVPHFVKHGNGHIVNMGSVAGRLVYAKGGVYCATKYAVRALNEGLRFDLQGTGIRVTEIAPGMVETEFSEVRLGDKAKAKTVYAGMTPLSPHDIAETVAWALSRPKHVNIQEIVVYPTDQASVGVVHRR